MTQPVEILVVEDDPDIRSVISMVLEDEGYTVSKALHGQHALMLLQQRAPALILLDMRMPIMDGWGFMAAYRQSSLPKVPVIVLSAARDAEVYAREVSATDHLSKPFRVDELLRMLDRYVPSLNGK